MNEMLKQPALASRAVLAALSLGVSGCAATLMSAGTAAAQPAPPVTQTEVRPSPIHAIPDAAPEAPDGDSALAGGVSPAASTLNAQMSALRRTAAASQAVSQQTMSQQTMSQQPATQQPANAQVAVAPDRRPADPAGEAPPAASVAMARRVMDAAAAFDSYVHRAAAISPDPHEGGDVAKAVLIGAAYEPEQLQEGAVAYAALAALQDGHFVQAVNDLGQDPLERRQLVRRLIDRPETALQLPGARDAGALVVSVEGRLGDSVISSGAAVKQASYTVQQQAWSKAPIEGPEALLASVKTQSATKVVLAPADAPALITNVVAAGRIGAAPHARTLAPTATVARGLALAALAVLGAAGDEASDQLAPVLSEAGNAQCLKMAKLNLNQCLAVAGPHYEGMFCLGRHGLMETGQCVVSAVGWTPAPPPAPASRSILVPIALASLSGSERDSVMNGRAAVMPPAPVAAPPTTVAYSPEPAAPTSPPPVAERETYAMAAAPVSAASLTAPSPWRPNGPQPGDSFVGGPYGAAPSAGSDAAQGDQDGGVAAPPPGYAYSYGPSTD